METDPAIARTKMTDEEKEKNREINPNEYNSRGGKTSLRNNNNRKYNRLKRIP